MNNIPKWFHIIMSVLFAILAICKAMLTCIEHQWGVIPGVLIALFLFGVLYGIFWFCFWFAERVTNIYAKAYRENIVPKIEMRAIEKYIADHPIQEPVMKSPLEVMDESNQQLTMEERLHRFMETYKKEREQYIAKRDKDNKEKLEKLLAYVRKTLIPYDFTAEELFQVNECVTAFVSEKIVVPTLPIKIERVGKKEELTQRDLQNFGWNIANQYHIDGMLTAQFVQYTFIAWYRGADTKNISKRLKNTDGRYRIPIDEHILDDEDEIQDG